MPSLKNSLPRYRKHRGTGQAVVTLSGRDHYLGKHGTAASRRQYDRLIAEWLANGRESLVSAPDGIYVAELLNRYLKFAKTYYVKGGKPTGELAGMKDAIRQVERNYPRALVVDFGPLALKAVRQQMIDAGRSRSTINQAVGRIKRIFRWGASEQLIPVAVHQSLATVEGLRRGKSAAPDRPRVAPVNAEDVEATIPHLPPAVADMVRLQRLAAMRPGEVCILRPCDVDRSDDVWVYRPSTHKNEHHGRQRLIYLGPQSQAVLLRYLARDSEAYCFQPRDSEAKRRSARHLERQTPISCGNRPGSSRKRKPKRLPGNCYSTCSYGRAIARACDKAKVAHWTANQLRHLAATEIRQRYGLEAAQIILGHSHADVTQIYAEESYPDSRCTEPNAEILRFLSPDGPG
ncbi:Site-specific tyrosine recombinase XerC [Durusdinium trenchii]|uniref:Site-specific tyrosine recombinase XerC n=1 Tax=Durusdinium trenchii TaxID=1381693 RepID=A0ABP0LH08_9DINO